MCFPNFNDLNSTVSTLYAVCSNSGHLREIGSRISRAIGSVAQMQERVKRQGFGACAIVEDILIEIKPSKNVHNTPSLKYK